MSWPQILLRENTEIRVGTKERHLEFGPSRAPPLSESAGGLVGGLVPKVEEGERIQGLDLLPRQHRARLELRCSPQLSHLKPTLQSHQLSIWLQPLFLTQAPSLVTDDKQQCLSSQGQRGAGSLRRVECLQHLTSNAVYKLHFIRRYISLGRGSLFSVWISWSFLIQNSTIPYLH